MRLFSILVILIYFASSLPPAFAARKLSITGDKTALRGDEEVTISASASGFVTGESIFIKGVFYKEGSANYFGFTKSGDSWIKNSTKTSGQRPIVIGSWDGTVTVKSDFADSGFSGNGYYLLKLGYYTIASDGDPSSVDWSDNSLPMSLEQPPPTNTTAPTSKPSSTPKPTILSTSTHAPSHTSAPENPSVLSSFSDEEEEGDILPESASTQSAGFSEEGNVLSVKDPAGFVQDVISSNGSTMQTTTNQGISALPFIYGGLLSGILSLVALGYTVVQQRKLGA